MTLELSPIGPFSLKLEIWDSWSQQGPFLGQKESFKVPLESNLFIEIKSISFHCICIQVPFLNKSTVNLLVKPLKSTLGQHLTNYAKITNECQSHVFMYNLAFTFQILIKWSKVDFFDQTENFDLQLKNSKIHWLFSSSRYLIQGIRHSRFQAQIQGFSKWKVWSALELKFRARVDFSQERKRAHLKSD